MPVIGGFRAAAKRIQASNAAAAMITNESRRKAQEEHEKSWRSVLDSQGILGLEAHEKKPKPFVDTNRFDFFIGGVIMLNAVVIGLETDHNRDPAAPSVVTVWVVLENVFCVVWVGEMIARMYFAHCKYFRSGWNLLDFFLVCTSVFEAWIVPNMGNTGFSGARGLSLLRMLRILRLLRLIKLMRAFKELWLLVQGTIASLRTMSWVLMLLFTVMYASGIYLTITVGQECETKFPDYENCYVYFGQVHRSMYSLFQIMTLGAWSEFAARPILEINPWLIIFFICFIFVTTLGLLNIIVGVMVENTVHTAQENVELQNRRHLKRKKTELESLRAVFEQVDVDKNGVIDRAEFEEIMGLPEIKQVFRDVEIPCDDPQMLFEIFGETIDVPCGDQPRSRRNSEVCEQKVQATDDVEGFQAAMKATASFGSRQSNTQTRRYSMGGSLAQVDVSGGTKRSDSAESSETFTRTPSIVTQTWKGFNIEEFIKAALLLRGEPKGYELRKTSVEVRTILQRVSAIEERASLLPFLLQTHGAHKDSDNVNADQPSPPVESPPLHTPRVPNPIATTLSKRLDDLEHSQNVMMRSQQAQLAALQDLLGEELPE